MLFHITHIHSPESCPYHNPEKARDTFGKVLVGGKELGVNLIGAWVDAPAHTAYFVIETDSAEKIEELLAPAIEIGRAKTRVVVDAAALLKRRTGEN